MAQKAFKKVLVANRGEIAIRAFRALHELGIRSVAIYPYEDRHSLHRQKADESYEIGDRGHPVRAYLDVDLIVNLAKRVGADAIYPGYGFLSENPLLSEACAKNGITFVGPSPKVLTLAGNKISAIQAAKQAGLPTLKSSPQGLTGEDLIRAAEEIGYPVFVKAAAGGGGRGLRKVTSRKQLESAIESASREAASAFGDPTLFIEEALEDAHHIEVQVLADSETNVIHLFERDCSIQRRHQKVIEIAPAPVLDSRLREKICGDAVAFAKSLNYTGAGTVEFLVQNVEDIEKSRYVFIEMNPRVQVEHTVTEEVTQVDIVQSQILIAAGHSLADLGLSQDAVRLLGSAVQCRVTAEDPEHDFRPDTGVITTYRVPGGSGIRLDEGTTLGTEVLPFFDSLLGKVTCRGRNFTEAVDRARRALAEMRIRGIKTNIGYLLAILDDPDFKAGNISTSFIESKPELLRIRQSADRGTRLLTYVAETTVNRPFGPPPTAGDPRDLLPKINWDTLTPAPGSKQALQELGPLEFARNLRNSQKIAVTDTTFRDAHQSLLATRMRTFDMLAVAKHISFRLPELFSLECWGGATFDTALRFLKEDPWERLETLRKAVPNICLQMLIRGRNTVGYTPYPDKVAKHFVAEAAKAGIDIFRIFDAQNDVEQIRPAVEAVLETDAVAEGTLCYTGNLAGPEEDFYNLDYYLRLAEKISATGVQILCIKDMAGLLRPKAAKILVSALRERFDQPVHLHTHDTAGGQLATYLAAVSAGVDAIDGAMAPLAGTTSQPALSSIVAATADEEFAPGIDLQTLLNLEPYFEAVRKLYRPFESGLNAPTGRVYRHEIPGGQITNMRQQAISLGLGNIIDHVEDLYAQVDKLFGRIVKVTPTSKVVGDLAMHLAAQGTTVEELEQNPEKFSLPESVIGFLAGELGTPPAGWPEPFRTRALANRTYTLPSKELTPKEEEILESGNVRQGLSELLFPGPAKEYKHSHDHFGNLSLLPSKAFFFGLDLGEEVEVELEPGLDIFLSVDAVSEPDERGFRNAFCRLNGRPRIVSVKDFSVASSKPSGEKASPDDPCQIAAPFSGVVTVHVKPNAKLEQGDIVATIEAMKMDAKITTSIAGIVQRVVVPETATVQAGDLLVLLTKVP